MNVLSIKCCAKYFICIPIKTNLRNLWAMYSYYAHITGEGTGA